MKHIVLLLPTHWAAVLGGAEYQVKILSEHLRATGRVRLTWVCRRIAEDYRPEGYEIRQVAPHTGLRKRGLFLDHFRLGRLLQELAPDAIYQRVGCAYTGIAARYARRSGCRMVWHVASDGDVTPANGWPLRDTLLPFRRLEKAALEYGIRHAPRIVVQTRHQASLLKTHYDRDAAALVRNFHPSAREAIDKSGPWTVLWIGNLKPVKNPLAFVDLAKAFADRSDVRFLMIGDPSGDPECAREIVRRAAEIPGFRFIGKQSQDQVNELLAKSHLLVNTSHYEGFSNTFIQAWMREVHVVSLNADPDGLLETEGLGSCAHGDMAALRSSAGLLMSDPTLWRQCGRRARDYAEANHTERNVQTLLDLLEH
jgi:glycosyltransferase involved in cell wall biosynthesis